MELSRSAVCRDCWALLRQPKNTLRWRLQQWDGRRSFAVMPARTRTTTSTTTTDTASIPPKERLAQSLGHTPRMLVRSAATQTSLNLNSIDTRILDLAASILKPEDRQLPVEQRVLYVFEQFDALASNVLSANPLPEDVSRPAGRTASLGTSDATATSALLGSVNAVRASSSGLTKTILLHRISETAEAVMRNANVFVTPPILKSYVDLQAKLDQPSSFPDIFQLYARKPVPTLSGKDMSTGVAYTTPSPDKVNSAIDSNTANAALSAAIKINNLSLAIDIIHTSFCAPSFKRSKILRQALIPISGLAIAPVAAYTLSSSFSTWQNTMSSDYATGLAFAGIMTYVATVGTMGYVTVTTANDQMDRITWAQGVPLWERWIREEERAAIDRVAAAWGFQDVARRGDEDGEEWHGLKEFVGLNGMVLDRVELMDGME